MQILYLRGVYPSASFSRRRKYGIPVVMCDHPWVSAFVADHLRSIREALRDQRKAEGLSGAEVAVGVDSDVRERFVFEFGRVEAEARRLAVAERSKSPSLLVGEELELKFRSLLLRMNSVLSSSSMDSLAEDEDRLTFSYRLRTTVCAACAVTAAEDLWAAAVDAGGSGGGVEEEEEGMVVIPIFGMTRPVNLSVYALKSTTSRRGWIHT